MVIKLSYTWEETQDKIIVDVPLTKVKQSDIDVFSTDVFLKVNCPPYLFQLDLFDEVDQTKSTAKITKDGVHFILHKKEPKIWGQAKAEGDANAIRERREKSIQILQQRMKEIREKKIIEKDQEQKRLFQKQWDLEKQLREQMEQRKEEIINQTLKEAWSKKPASEGEQGESTIHTVDEDDEAEEPAIADSNNNEADERRKKAHDRESKDSIFGDSDSTSRFKSSMSMYASVPPPRETTSIKMTFTPRALQTPAREGKDEQLAKELKLPKGALGGDVEDNPLWLKDRGDHFFKRNDIKAAINAYTASLKKDDRFLSSYANRAACYLKLNDLDACISDCTKALDILEGPQMKENYKDIQSKHRKTFLHLFLRRGSAYCKKGDIQKCYEDYKKALEIEPNDQQLNEEFDQIAKYVESEEGKDQVIIHKERGDTLCKRSDYQNAIHEYTKSLELLSQRGQLDNADNNCLDESIRFRCYLNRAMCHLKLNQLAECIDDCTFVLENIHKYNSNNNGANDTEDDAAESESRKGKKIAAAGYLILKALVRRGSAYSAMGDYHTAFNDYEQAVKMFPNDEALFKDFQDISAKLNSQKDGEWYKNRGNFFYKSGNLPAAKHSYTLAIEAAQGKNPIFFANRSQCHLKMGNFEDCIRDCDAALELINNNKTSKMQRGGAPFTNPADLYSFYSSNNNTTISNTATIETTMSKSGGASGNVEKGQIVKIYLRKATALSELGRKSEALGVLDQARNETDPTNSAALALITNMSKTIGMSSTQQQSF